MIRETCIDNDISDAVLNVLRYYALFSYPLKAEEIYGNLSVACSFASLLVTLEDMDEVGDIYRCDGYYSIEPSVQKQVARRKAANILAAVKKEQALRVGRFIYKFPFVRFVGISGSLSKGYADEKSDFDFFIVTTANRLWISRTILHLFKKLTFIARQQHKFCMNYFVDTDKMQIEEKNRFTAIELSSLIPAAGQDAYMQLMCSNTWVNDFMPNRFIGFYDGIDNGQDKKNILKTVFEFILNKLFPGKMNTLMMRWTDKKWKRKWAHKNYPADEYGIAFKTTLHISKNHPANHQKRVLKALSKFDNKNSSQ